MLEFPTQALCQVRRAERKEELCLEPLDKIHSFNCQAGASRFRPHRTVLMELAEILRRAGAFVDVECFCSDLAKQDSRGVIREAWMDVCAQIPGCNILWRFDVTIRSTFADYPNTATRPGAAAAAGVSAKRSRYGEQVIAVAFEPLGRLAPQSIDGLWLLASEAAARGRLGSAAALYRRWRLDLERALLWSTAETALVATGSQASVRWS